VATAGHPTVEAEPRPPASDGAATPGADAVSNPVVRGGERLAVIRKKVLLRLLAAREAERLRIPIGPEDVERIAAAIRRASGLETAERWQAWLAAEGLSEETVAAILGEFVAVERLEARFGAEIAERVPDHIRINALRVGWSSEGSA
jgi:hypothetical protein